MYQVFNKLFGWNYYVIEFAGSTIRRVKVDGLGNEYIFCYSGVYFLDVDKTTATTLVGEFIHIRAIT